jgi:hypothetical protein
LTIGTIGTHAPEEGFFYFVNVKPIPVNFVKALSGFEPPAKAG